MFDKLQQAKKLMDLRSQAMKMQKTLHEERVVVEEKGIKIVMTGDQRVQEVMVNGENNKAVVEALNKALKKTQEVAAKKYTEMGGGLSGLLGM